ncbi:MAG TPA: glycosyltransferase family 8 protein [Feifaniaceae bacterium]|nr:glycosyltransferase family 8 protein [Feifaniaceae bacterium]
MNILVTLNENYVGPLKVMLWSLFFNNPHESFRVYLIHSSISAQSIGELEAFVSKKGHALDVIRVPDDWFTDAPAMLYYSKEMYYRLLAYQILPAGLEKILYLDPDILVINPIRALYDTDITGYLFGAAHHQMISVKEINMVRLNAYEMEEYFNTGVLLMNLALQRQKINAEDLFAYIAKNKNRLILPDQDILNALYSKETQKLNAFQYNYDARRYQYYKFLSDGEIDMDYIMRHTVLLHFCGKRKPWHSNYIGKFHSLYKHYEQLALRES